LPKALLWNNNYEQGIQTENQQTVSVRRDFFQCCHGADDSRLYHKKDADVFASGDVVCAF
jgi:hypothetical protein